MTLEINTDDWKNRHDILLGEYRHLVMQLADTEALEISHGERIIKQRETIAALKKQRDELLNALDDAASSLETIAVRSHGESSYLDSTQQMRGYADSRAGIARAAIASVKEQGK